MIIQYGRTKTHVIFTRQSVQLKAGIQQIGTNSSNVALSGGVFFRYEVTPLNPWEGKFPYKRLYYYCITCSAKCNTIMRFQPVKF